MPEPAANTNPQPTPSAAPAANTNPQPSNLPAQGTVTSIPPQAMSALDSIKAAMEKEFGGTGVIPPGSQVAPTGGTGPAPAPAATGPTGGTAPAATGPTGGTAPAGVTGPTGLDAPTGPTGTQYTQEQLDRAQEKMTPAAGSAFRQVRHELAQSESARTTDQARIAELETALAARPASEEVSSLQTKVQDYEKRLAVVDYQSTVEFQNNIAKPLANVETNLNTLATQHNIAPEDLRAALAEPDRVKRNERLSELSANFNRLDMATFDRNVADYDRLSAERKQTLEGAFEKMQQLQQDTEAASKRKMAEFKVAWTNSLDTTLQKLEKDIPIFIPTGDDKWDIPLKNGIAAVKAMDVASLSNEALATALYKNQVFDLLLKQMASLVEANVSLDDTVTKLRGGTPPAGGGNVPEITPQPSGPTAGTSFMQLLKDRLPTTGLPS